MKSLKNHWKIQKTWQNESLKNASKVQVIQKLKFSVKASRNFKIYERNF